ncbi:sensor histidine kinase [Mesorhizobium xinjiangense]|uniref:sensor histidine kinase n=1 Tax=Mesorhizobium xinjiangense TaxID=2678685 RepID=UPI0012EE743A|nr:HAMP domain-containing sensor histidine kinase [Mesorhizobium xinjiangense]
MELAPVSIRWKLSLQLSLVFTAFVAAVIVGLCVYGAMVLSPNLTMSARLSSAIADAVFRTEAGRLAVRDTPELDLIKKQNEKLWYVVATPDGETITYGSVPVPFAGLVGQVHLFRVGDIRGASYTDEIASIDSIATGGGEVRVMFGSISGDGWPIIAVLKSIYPVYLPLLALAPPLVFLVVPRIVRRTLAGLNDVVRRSTEIDPRRLGSRLPVEKVPQEVAPLVSGFNDALDRLEHEIEARQRFLIDAAHELRTPIAIMQTRIEGMADSPTKQRLLKNIARLGETAEQLLDFERNEQTKGENTTVDLVALAKQVVGDFAPLAIAAGYEISFESDADNVERLGNEAALKSALGNLVRNAIDHGGNSGLIAISVSATGEIVVADEGPGIPADLQELVFQPFYRVTPRNTGAGLGLSLVKQIVANHGGQVAIESGPGGTRFSIAI